MNNKEAAEYIKAHCNPDMTQKTQWEIAMVMAVKALLSGQQKGNIEEDPTIDAVEVVRCRECRYYGHECVLLFPEDGYCYDGKRRDEERLDAVEQGGAVPQK